jgi:hypothetical protein
MTVKQCIKLLDAKNKRTDFIKDYGITPEEYFTDSDIKKELWFAIDDVCQVYKLKGK